MKKDKSLGKDGIPAELIKNLGTKDIEAIINICNSIWRTKQWLEDWIESVFIPLHKKGSTKKCSDYRIIALISHASKILLHIINKQLKNFLVRHIRRTRKGFVKGKDTRH